MAYREAAPSAVMAAWIECYWTRHGKADGPDCVLPDGCADVIFDVDHADGFVVGTMTAPLVIPEEASPTMFGIRFHTGRALLGIGVPLRELTDTRASLRDARSIAAGFAGRVADAPSFEARIEVVERMLLGSLSSTAADPFIDAAVAHIACGSSSVDATAATLGVTRQHLARKFAGAVGVSPKMFARIARFRRVLRKVRSHDVDWADVAVATGYFDQSHLIADFRDFAGTSPVPFFLSRQAATT